MVTNNAVILFIYNRPDHTEKVIEGLRKNKIQKLYVFSDGPKTDSDRKLVEETREIIESITWCQVESEYSVTNKGLADSVIYGVSKIFSKGYKSVIVLEDDCVPNENYIRFMRESLNYYGSNKEVMHVSGFGLPIKKYTNADVYITPYPCSWGWGTWAEYWNNCNFNGINEYRELLNNKQEIKRFNYPGEAFSSFLQLQLDRKVNSWLIRWYFHIYSNHGKCVWSYDSLIENKGFDGTGVHKVRYDRFNQKKSVAGNNVKKKYILEDNMNYHTKLIKEFRRYFINKSIKERLKTILYMSTGIILESRRNYKVIK
ncbi:sugar transferase [Paenibacillus abyssi]|uniref:Sugar transferase n=1 Tax=Paenibacillus abyssi TaxID=1340531 RepID=A0A917LGM1_9BACL|nr:sugar transferase [Paenibacillus abyssi]GGG21680.1 hypothetical protein GCM10010916_42980 [Paenibacillus abyssi]